MRHNVKFIPQFVKIFQASAGRNSNGDVVSENDFI